MFNRKLRIIKAFISVLSCEQEGRAKSIAIHLETLLPNTNKVVSSIVKLITTYKRPGTICIIQPDLTSKLLTSIIPNVIAYHIHFHII